MYLRRTLCLAITAAAVLLGCGLTPDVIATEEGYELNTDRDGSDYEDFDLSSPDPRLCADACAEDDKCKAWTYVRAGYQGAAPRCWLKDSVPEPEPNECCISGLP